MQHYHICNGSHFRSWGRILWDLALISACLIKVPFLQLKSWTLLLQDLVECGKLAVSNLLAIGRSNIMQGFFIPLNVSIQNFTSELHRDNHQMAWALLKYRSIERLHNYTIISLSNAPKTRNDFWKIRSNMDLWFIPSQEARFPQLRTLTVEQRARLKSSFINFDDFSFCEWMRSLKLVPPEPA